MCVHSSEFPRHCVWASSGRFVVELHAAHMRMVGKSSEFKVCVYACKQATCGLLPRRTPRVWPLLLLSFPAGMFSHAHTIALPASVPMLGLGPPF